MHVWLIGAGAMAVDYLKVLMALNCRVSVIGRGSASARAFEAATGHPVIAGGVEGRFASGDPLPAAAIVCVDIEELANAATTLVRGGVRQVLVEKPAAIEGHGLRTLAQASAAAGARVFVAYNRRFFAATLHAKKLIEDDGGLISCNFEFTEWAHVIERQLKPAIIKERWFLANSTHVVDLAFHLAGAPVEMSSYASGSIAWHPSASCFCGAGVTESGALFSYSANWTAPGRWGVEVLTSTYRLILRPMETLQLIRRGTVQVEPVRIDDTLDKDFKPGLYLQVERFLSGSSDDLCAIHEHLRRWPFYCRMASYEPTKSGAI